jgi:hypothetical protein
LALQVTAEGAQQMLKELIWEMWATEDCESLTDTLKFLSLVDFYLPFLPLEREHIRSLFTLRLQERQAEVYKATKDILMWDDLVLDFLVSKVSSPPPLEWTLIPLTLELNLNKKNSNLEVQLLKPCQSPPPKFSLVLSICQSSEVKANTLIFVVYQVLPLMRGWWNKILDPGTCGMRDLAIALDIIFFHQQNLFGFPG